MSSEEHRSPQAPDHSVPHPGIALAVLASMQFVVTFNGTSINLALPDVTRSLELSTGLAVWVVSGYVLAFGGLILLSGRLADLVGRRALLLFGVALFAVGAVASGFAGDGITLIAARIAQGAGAAAIAPATLALIASTFPAEAARRRALGVWGAVASAGSGAGVLGGGALTAWLGWRSVLLVNVPIALVLLIAAVVFVPRVARIGGDRPNIVGAALSVLGLGSLIGGLTAGSRGGWLQPSTLVPLGAGVVLLLVLLWQERQSTRPFIPRHLLAIWPAAAGPLAMLLGGFALYPVILAASILLQRTLGYSPLVAGALILPSSIATLVGSSVTPRLIARVGTLRYVVASLALLGLSSVAVSFVAFVGPSLAGVTATLSVFGFALGGLITGAISLTLNGARPSEAGTASGLAQTGQQIGGALGLTLLATVTAGPPGTVDVPAYGLALLIAGSAAVIGAGLIAVRSRRAP